jgi:hypothetical protein
MPPSGLERGFGSLALDGGISGAVFVDASLGGSPLDLALFEAGFVPCRPCPDSEQESASRHRVAGSFAELTGNASHKKRARLRKMKQSGEVASIYGRSTLKNSAFARRSL